MGEEVAQLWHWNTSSVPNTLTNLAVVELQRYTNISHQAAHGQQDSVTLTGLELHLHCQRSPHVKVHVWNTHNIQSCTSTWGVPYIIRGGGGGGGQKKYIWEKTSKESGIPTQLSENSPCQSSCLEHTHSNWYGTSTWGVPYHKLGDGWVGREGGRTTWDKSSLGEWHSGWRAYPFQHFTLPSSQSLSRRWWSSMRCR